MQVVKPIIKKGECRNIHLSQFDSKHSHKFCENCGAFVDYLGNVCTCCGLTIKLNLQTKQKLGKMLDRTYQNYKDMFDHYIPLKHRRQEPTIKIKTGMFHRDIPIPYFIMYQDLKHMDDSNAVGIFFEELERVCPPQV